MADNISMELSKEGIVVDIGQITMLDGAEYDGAYEITPTFSKQTLNTAGKTLSKNVIGNAIPVESVSNASGGRTVIIGG